MRLVMICLSMILFIFGCSSDENKVKNYSLADVLLSQIVYVHDSNDDLSKKEDAIDELVNSYEKNRGIDISKSFYSILENNKDVSDLILSKQNIPNSYLLSFRHKESDVKINFVVTGEPIIDVITDVNYPKSLFLFGYFYGVSQGDLEKVYSMLSPFYLPNN